MVHSNGEKLWLIIIEISHSETALHQFQIAVQGDGPSTCSLVCCDVVGSTFGLRLKLDAQKRKSNLLV
jgi:hypothetical protein